MASLYPPSRYEKNRAHDTPPAPHELLTPGNITVLAGDPKAGKTTFLAAMALAVATGTEFLGSQTDQGPVLWITGEESADAIFDMLDEFPWDQEKIYPGQERPGIIPFYVQSEFPDYDDLEQREQFEYQVRRIKPRLIVVDSLICSPNAHSLNSDQGTRLLMNGLGQTASHAGCPMVIIHHLSRKGVNQMTNSMQIGAAAWQTWFFNSLILPDRRFLTLERKGRGRKSTDSLLIESRNQDHYALLETLPSETSHLTLKQRVLIELTTGPKTAIELSEAMSEKPDTVQRNLARLVIEGLATVEAIEGNAHRYAIRASETLGPPQSTEAKTSNQPQTPSDTSVTSDALSPRALPDRELVDDSASGARVPENSIATANQSVTSETSEIPNLISEIDPASDLSGQYDLSVLSDHTQTRSVTSETSEIRNPTSEIFVTITPDRKHGKPTGNMRFPYENGFIEIPTYPSGDDEPLFHTEDIIRAEKQFDREKRNRRQRR